MAAVQTMRARAQAAGSLQSTPQLTVVRQSPQTIAIEAGIALRVARASINRVIIAAGVALVACLAPNQAVIAIMAAVGNIAVLIRSVAAASLGSIAVVVIRLRGYKTFVTSGAEMAFPPGKTVPALRWSLLKINTVNQYPKERYPSDNFPRKWANLFA
jgi:hypothetical protein